MEMSSFPPLRGVYKVKDETHTRHPAQDSVSLKPRDGTS